MRKRLQWGMLDASAGLFEFSAERQYEGSIKSSNTYIKLAAPFCYLQQVTHQHINHLVFLHLFYFRDVFFQASAFCREMKKKKKNTSHNYAFSSNVWKLIFRTKHMGCYLTTEFCLQKYLGAQYLVNKRHRTIWTVIPILWRLPKCDNLCRKQRTMQPIIFQICI